MKTTNRLIQDVSTLTFLDCERAHTLLAVGLSPLKGAARPLKRVEAPNLPALKTSPIKRIGGFPALRVRVDGSRLLLPPIDLYWIPGDEGGWRVGVAIEVAVDEWRAGAPAEAVEAAKMRLAEEVKVIAVHALKEAAQKNADVVLIGWTTTTTTGRTRRTVTVHEVSPEFVARSAVAFAELNGKRRAAASREAVKKVALAAVSDKGANPAARILRVLQEANALKTPSAKSKAPAPCAICPFGALCSGGASLKKKTEEDLKGYALKGCDVFDTRK